MTVTGTVDNLDIKFSSTPELPQDEVLAQLIFKRSIGELSAFQIAQLAAAAAELAGGSNNSLMNKLRAGTGLDDLDVVTDDKGQTAVRAGRYIRDNIYLGVEAGSGGSTKGTVNLDITRNLKAKGSLGAEGDSSGGIFYEKIIDRRKILKAIKAGFHDPAFCYPATIQNSGFEAKPHFRHQIAMRYIRSSHLP